MAAYAGPNIVEDGLRVSVDAGNIKCYPGSGSTLFSLNGTENATSTSAITTASDATAGTILDHNNSALVTVNLSPTVNHEVWSFVIWLRSTGTTPANYRQVLRLEQTGGPGYFYILDTRETTNSRLLGFQKDYNISAFYTVTFNTAAQWDDETWWCLGVSHNNAVFKSYRQGELFNTATHTNDVSGYTDLTKIFINYSANNTVYMGPFLFYDKILTDEEFRQNFNAHRGRFGI